ncbi:hypothetical protein [Pseudoduganella violacea]|uniref:Uncharacterized protein n=1 Tax=Pseudoduganella violacea TaxID=1715466 RepID=A0A7W5B7T5_9BURK|nr:hypothetical protein [Pseudoduganella violacea]MBB3118138.1 hypothetical protein [Pseudoduganella violacea]
MTISDKEYFDARSETVDTKLLAIDAKFDAKFDQQRAELHALIAQTIKWVAAVSASGLVIFTTVIAFLFNVTTPKAALPAAAALPAPTPVVIVVPGSGGEAVKVLPR